MVETYCISIYCKGNSNIILKREESTPKSVWKNEVVHWWTPDQLIDSDYIEIAISEFILKRSWVSKIWAKDGRQYQIDLDTKSILEKAIAENSFFKKLTENNSLSENLKTLRNEDYLRKPTEFQLKNISNLIHMPAGANFSVPGAGKTSTTLIVWNELRRTGSVGKLLVVCPRSAFEAWESEPKEVFIFPVKTEIYTDGPIDPSIDILITNYEKLESIHRLSTLMFWAKHNKAQLIIDEAHRIKGGQKSVRWRRCKQLSSASSRVDLLTGTPMPQSYDDLRNLFSISWPNVSLNSVSDSILNNIKNGQLFVRTTKRELKLPPLEIIKHSIEQGKIQSEIYDALKKRYVGTFSITNQQESYFGSKGRAVMTLLAVSSNPGLLAGIDNYDAYQGLEWPPRSFNLTESLLHLAENYSNYEIPPKYNWIAQFCKKAMEENRKILIWSNFIGNINALQKLLIPFKPAIVYGQTSIENRIKEIDRFKFSPDCNVLISNPQTLGEGVSLHKECHEAIYLDRSYNAGQYLQSLDRIHRLGLPSDQMTRVHILETKGTIDIRVTARLEMKIKKLAEALNDDGLVKVSLPDDDISLPNEILGIDQYDLEDLFEHLKNND